MRASLPLKAIVAATLVVVSACAKRPMVSPASDYPADCVALAASGPRSDTVTVALFDRVVPEYAPWGHNASERLVFQNLYETLVTVDCRGDVKGALAASWRSHDRGRRWTLTLREDARFWDGERVTAGEVVSAWQDALTLDTAIDSARASGARTVDVYPSRAERGVPRALAAPAFAVAKRSGDSRWPLGTGPFRVATPPRADGAVVAVPAFGRSGPTLEFVQTPARDARDLLEGGVDLMVTADPAVVEYARGQPQLVTVAMPWEKTYALLSPARATALRRGEERPTIPVSLAEDLARDAVRCEARAAEAPFWWDDAGACGEPQPGAAAPAPSGVREILYDQRDAVARDLAHRIVALAASDPATTGEVAALESCVPGLGARSGEGPAVVARGVGAVELAQCLREGSDLAYVVALARSTPMSCYEVGQLLERAPWLGATGGGIGAAIVPLVDTRAHAIARGRGFGVVVGGYGDVLIVGETVTP